MRLLLDTHALIWSASEAGRLSARARELIGDPENDRFVSAASVYEIEFKRQKDPELGRLPTDLDDLKTALVFDWLPIEEDHAARAGRLPRHHGDPWDRLIVAQAFSEGLAVVSIDRTLARYGVPVLW